MPISKDEWSLGRRSDTLEAQILSFLKKNQNNAFTLTEIMNGIGYSIETKDFWSFISGVAGYWVFQTALENLAKEGTVEARKIKQPIGEQTYYKAK